MAEYNFSIQQIRLVEGHFSLNPRFRVEKDQHISFGNKFEIKFRAFDPEKTVSVLLSAASEAKDQPFQYRVAHEGFFRFETLPAPEDLGRVVHVHLAAVIFPFLRETVADLTRRANLHPLVLPPFNFEALHRQKQQNRPPVLKTEFRQ